ncbi:WG repeat-containing protein [Sphingomonas sp. RT2P30]|uniref:WG repeat-containing protein n=1 Tax=Parasphingomonas halimpatiens TaxID=3096162 RepID=UPI002FC5BFC2
MNNARAFGVIASVAASIAIVSPAAAGHKALLRPCTYAFNVDIGTFAHCARLDRTGRMSVRPFHLRRLAFDRHGLANIYVDGWYYVRRDGRSAPVMTLDNGAEGFSDGLARSQRRGKIGYIDQRLGLVIARRYDGAYPFASGVATVCIGCEVKMRGEHGSYVGGRWGCIDRRGVLVGPMRRQTDFRDCPPAD